MDYEKLFESCYMQVYSFVVALCRNKHLAEDISTSSGEFECDYPTL